MIEVQGLIEVARPPADVFAFIDTDANTPRWLSRCVNLVQVSEGPKKLGTVLRYTYREAGRTGTIDGVITTYEPGRRLAVNWKDSVLDVKIFFDMAEKPDGKTDLDHRIEITPLTMIAKLLSPIIRRATRKAVPEDLQRLKTLLDNGE